LYFYKKDIMDPKNERQTLIVKINSKLKKISDKVNYSKNEDDLSELSILFNVNDELEDVLLNWDSNQVIPENLRKLFEEFKDLDEDF